MNDNSNNPQQPTSYIDDYKPPVTKSVNLEGNISDNVSGDVSDTTNDASNDTANDNSSSLENSESLENQNIFFMLDADDGSEELKENFLNELQKVIWDDFLKNDVDLLITSDEKKEFDSIKMKNNEETQDELIAYLEKLIPDLEDIMLEKALDLKEDLFVERIAGMREYHASNPDNLASIDKAEKMMKEDKWHSAAELLNKIASSEA